MVVKGGAILSIAVNRNNIHAEVAALKKLWPSKRRGTKVISIRVDRRGRLNIARPCCNCIKYLSDNGIVAIWYSKADEHLEYESIGRPYEYD